MVRDRILEIIELNKKIQVGHKDGSISYKNYSERL
jgi:predicted house-cleaning noncanonical NTP pyrophosphatase (MazG superfamily)